MKFKMAVLALVFGCSAMGHAGYTRGYYKKNGTYVHSYNRTNPDRYRYNNYSAKGNLNPYTYKKGTQAHEYTYPPKYNKSYWGR